MTLFAHEPSQKNKAEDNPFAPVGIQNPPPPYWNRYLSQFINDLRSGLLSNENLRVTSHDDTTEKDSAESQNLWQQPEPFNPSRGQGRKFFRVGVSEYVKLEEERSFSSDERDFDKLPSLVKRKAEESTELGNLFHSFIECYDFSGDLEAQIKARLSSSSQAEKELIRGAMESLLNNKELSDLIGELKINPTNFQREFGLFLLSDEYRLTGFADLLWFRSKEELCIVDWKTGSNMSRLQSRERIEKFKLQLGHYANAFAGAFKNIKIMVIAIELSKDSKSKKLFEVDFSL